MSSAAVTLQCPACGGVFLTLQQGMGEVEICPHCSLSASRGRYYTIEAQASPGSPSVLPPIHAEQANSPSPSETSPVAPAEHAPAAAYAPPVSAPQPPAVTMDSTAAAMASPAQLWEAALLRQHQEQAPAPMFSGTEAVGTGAPARAQETPLPLPPLAHLEPALGQVLTTTTGPLPQPQIGFVPPATSELTPTVFPPHPQVQAHSPAPVVRPVSPFGIAGAVPAADPAEPPPLPAPPGLSVHIAPPLPGAVSHEQTAVPHGPEAFSSAASTHATPHATQDLALVAVKMMRNSGPPTVVHHPPRRAPWVAGLIFGSLALAGGLHFMKDLWQPVGKPVTSDIAQRASSSPGESKPKPLPVLKETILPQQKVAAVNAEKAPDPTPAPSTTSTQVPLQATAQTATNTPPPAAPEMPEVHVATATKPEGIHPAAAPEIVAIPVPSTPPSPPAPPLSPSPAASALEPAPPQEEVRRALPSNAATLSISKQDPLPVIAAKLVFGIDSATTPEERARWIADPAKHGTDMEQFVKMHGGRLNTREVESLPTAGPVHALPSGEAVTLFRVNSPNSRGGAMVRLHTTANGNHVIDWPLFAQTYDNAFDRFVAANRISPSEAEWYTVLCNLIADPNTKNAREEPRLMLKVQGSLAKTGVTEAWVDKNSPVGQYLQKKVIYGRTYIVELQFSTSGEDGRHLKVLDCAATKGETAQANANN